MLTDLLVTKNFFCWNLGHHRHVRRGTAAENADFLLLYVDFRFGITVGNVLLGFRTDIAALRDLRIEGIGLGVRVVECSSESANMKASAAEHTGSMAHRVAAQLLFVAYSSPIGRPEEPLAWEFLCKLLGGKFHGLRRRAEVVVL